MIEFQKTRIGDFLVERKEIPDLFSIESGAISVVSKIGFAEGKIELRTKSGTKTGMISIQPGDLVLSGINAAKGAIALYDEKETKPIAATIHYSSYSPNKEKVDLRYLWRFLRSNYFRDILAINLPNGIKTELKANRFLPLEIPLPSLEEQRRIVIRLDSISARVDETWSLRQLAIDEAESLIPSFLNISIKDYQNRYKTQWLEELLVDSNYGTSVKCYSEREKDAIPVLRIPNVASEKVSLQGLKFGNLGQAELKKTSLQRGDILIVRTNGSADLVGRCAVIPSLPEQMSFASYLIRIRCDLNVIEPEFVQLILRQQRTSGSLIDFARTTAGQYNVSLGRLRKTIIPIPPLDEQHRIVAYLDGLQAKVDELRRLQSESKRELSALMPSILDRAFKGEL